MTDLGLKGKIAVVTGSSRGWGRGIALELVARGARVVIHGRNAESVERTCSEVRKEGGEAIGAVAELGSLDAPGRVVDAAVDAFGGIDILVNNAGFLAAAPLVEMTDEQWDGIIAVQLSAHFRASRQAARHMIAAGRGGRIINMVGGGGFTGLFNNANHCASKGGGMGAVLTWAHELAPHKITVNGVCGIVATELTRPLHDKIRRGLKEAGQRSDLTARELGSYPPEEAAAIVVWLASESASSVTGQFFEITGPLVSLWRMASIERSIHHFPKWTPELLEEAGIGKLAAGPLRIEPTHASKPMLNLLK
jgi:NAD(P)-dependent dehydrogenase (short-subunit alcohol dehydrogenase family)